MEPIQLMQMEPFVSSSMKKVETYHDIKGTFHYDAHFDKTIVPGEVVVDTPTEENFPLQKSMFGQPMTKQLINQDISIKLQILVK